MTLPQKSNRSPHYERERLVLISLATCSIYTLLLKAIFVAGAIYGQEFVCSVQRFGHLFSYVRMIALDRPSIISLLYLL